MKEAYISSLVGRVSAIGIENTQGKITHLHVYRHLVIDSLTQGHGAHRRVWGWMPVGIKTSGVKQF